MSHTSDTSPNHFSKYSLQYSDSADPCVEDLRQARGKPPRCCPGGPPHALCYFSSTVQGRWNPIAGGTAEMHTSWTFMSFSMHPAMTPKYGTFFVTPLSSLTISMPTLREVVATSTNLSVLLD